MNMSPREVHLGMFRTARTSPTPEDPACPAPGPPLRPRPGWGRWPGTRQPSPRPPALLAVLRFPPGCPSEPPPQGRPLAWACVCAKENDLRACLPGLRLRVRVPRRRVCPWASLRGVDTDPFWAAVFPLPPSEERRQPSAVPSTAQPQMKKLQGPDYASRMEGPASGEPPARRPSARPSARRPAVSWRPGPEWLGRTSFVLFGAVIDFYSSHYKILLVSDATRLRLSNKLAVTENCMQ